MADRDSIYSTLRERIVEHVFVGEALRALWRRGITDIEVFRSEFDAHGYDLAFSRGAIVRHIQFKTQKKGAVSVSLSLATKPSGCVILIGVDKHLNLTDFRWFGGLPGQQLPDIAGFKVPRRATHTKEGKRPPRQKHRNVPRGAFERLATMDDVLTKLFGALES